MPRFIRAWMPEARVVTASSTAEAVRPVPQRRAVGRAGSRPAAELYGCIVLAAGVEDVPGNQTRFVWLARGRGATPEPGARPIGEPGDDAALKTAIVFWGEGTERPGWLVACLSAFADRGVNMNRIESRPAPSGLGSYMFFVDMEGRSTIHTSKRGWQRSVSTRR